MYNPNGASSVYVDETDREPVSVEERLLRTWPVMTA